MPKELVDFIQEDPVVVFFIAYEEIFKLFHTQRLDYNMVRLYAIDTTMKIRRDGTYVAIVDPYYMHDSHLVEGSKTWETTAKYLVRVMLANKRKNALLLLFFFEQVHIRSPSSDLMPS